MVNKDSVLGQQVQVLQNYADNLKQSLRVFEANNAQHFRKQQDNDELMAAAINMYIRNKVMAEHLQRQLQELMKEEKIRNNQLEAQIATQNQQAAFQLMQDKQEAFEEYLQTILESSKTDLANILVELTELTRQFAEMLDHIGSQLNVADVEYLRSQDELTAALNTALDFTLNPALAALKDVIADEKIRHEFINQIAPSVQNIILAEIAKEPLDQRQFAEKCGQQIQAKIENLLKTDPMYQDLTINVAKTANILVKNILSHDVVHEKVQQFSWAGQNKKDWEVTKTTVFESQQNMVQQTDKISSSFASLQASPTAANAKDWQNDLSECAMLLKYIQLAANTMKQNIQKMEHQVEHVYKHIP